LRTLLHSGLVFDGTGASPEAADVVIEDGRIVAVGTGLDGDEAVDLQGKTLLPGFIDCHVHLMLTDLNVFKRLYLPPGLVYYEAIRNLEATLFAGVTTVRDATGADAGVKRAVESRLIRGPRVQISIIGLSQTGGHGDGYLPCGVNLASAAMAGMPTGVADGPDEVRRSVRELIRAGADVIKICTSGGIISAHDDPHAAHFNAEELSIIVEEATRAGRGVMSHAHAAAGVKSATLAGVRSIEHGIFLDEEAVRLMVERGTYLVPTLLASHGLVDADAADRIGLSDEAMDKAHSVGDAHVQSFRLALEAGVKIAMGTDSAITPHGKNLRELSLMAKYGMSPEEALRAATSSAAELLGLSDQIGTIEVGKRADLVVVDGDALELDSLPDRITQVYQDGEAVLPAV